MLGSGLLRGVVLVSIALPLGGCEKDPCSGGQVRKARTGTLSEEWCERGGVRDGYYRARDGGTKITGRYRGGVPVGGWNWIPEERDLPTRYVEYSEDGHERERGGYFAGEYHGHFVTHSKGFGPDPDRWYKSSDIVYRCGRMVSGAFYSYYGEAKPITPDPPPDESCPP